MADLFDGLTPPAPSAKSHAGKESLSSVETGLPSLLLVHPAITGESARAFLHAVWPDADLAFPPPGYRDVSHAFSNLRAFCHESVPLDLSLTGLALARKAAMWVDGLARDWQFAEAFTAQDLDFWEFLHDGMANWLYARLRERSVFEQLIAAGPASVVAVGLDADQRALLRRLAEIHAGRFRVEIAFCEPPVPLAIETAAGRRVRKLFLVLQDGWHGVKLVVENLCNRRPKVLFVSNERCWRRSWNADGRLERTDQHLQSVWREGRSRSLRLYYRSDSYHPDVGAMTAGRLAPTYLRHFLFLLAQTSRGYWEVRRIQRQWRELAQRPDFRAALTCDGLAVDDLVVAWLERAVTQQLPGYVRVTRRERHFLQGVQPAVLVLTHDREANRAIIAAARRLGIPTMGVQSQALPVGDYVWRGPRSRSEGTFGLPDRLCVFSPEAKRLLVEDAGLDPSRVVVTGDPHLGAGTPGARPSPTALRTMRGAWGAEETQRVIAIVCRLEECAEILAWLSPALRDRDDAVLVLHPIDGQLAIADYYRMWAARHGLRWFHHDAIGAYADWPAAADLIVTTQETYLAEGVRAGTPAVLVDLGATAPFWGPDPGSLITHAHDAGALDAVLRAFLAAPVQRLPEGEQRNAYLCSIYGAHDAGAAARVMDAVESLLARR
jgi:hypothetical protein